MIQKPTNRNFKLSPENFKLIQQLTEELKLDNPNKTLNVIVKNYGEFKRLEHLFNSFVGFYEAFNALAMENVYTLVKNAGLESRKQLQKEVAKLAASREVAP